MIGFILVASFLFLSYYLKYINRNDILYYVFSALCILSIVGLISYNANQEPYLNFIGIVGFEISKFLTSIFTKFFSIVILISIMVFPKIDNMYHKRLFLLLLSLFLFQLPFKSPYFIDEYIGFFKYPVFFIFSIALIYLNFKDMLFRKENNEITKKEEDNYEVVAYESEKHFTPTKINENEEIKKPQLVYRNDILSVLYSEEEEKEQEVEDLSKLIEDKFLEFNISGKVVSKTVGPLITRYEFEPAAGVKLSKIQSLSDDLTLRLKTADVRITSPLPNKGLIGIEVPNKRRKIVYFKKLVQTEEFKNSKKPLLFTLGVDVEGNVKYEDLSKMPHLLIAGSTGSGKSVCINTIVASLLIKNSQNTVRFLLIDPKMVELSLYEGIPHLLMPVIRDRKQAVKALKMAVAWMEYRYTLLAKVGAKSLESYNMKTGNYKPYIVIIIDEFADLILTQGKEVEGPIARLAQMARAVGIHLVVATQRPSVDVITGIIKANFPVRIAFKVPSKIDSRVILDTIGAEKLLGMGDMLYIPPGSSEPQRFHASFISEEEITNIVSKITFDYLNQKFIEKFSKTNQDLIYKIMQNNYIGVFCREDEVALEEKQRVVSEWIKEYLNLNLSNEQIIQMIDEIRSEYYEPIEEFSAYVEEDEDEVSEISGSYDPLIKDAIKLIAGRKTTSATFLQRKLKIGFARAARIVDQLEELGIVGPADGPKPREVRISPEKLDEILRRL
ncbi:MAG: DNA translocase FtsK [candidate division WOR-3 bacterium]|nr:DNA translocase FtsK [candidate division WOR-3 bacterium]MCX7948010.1 DNA translocase FtsK [candidate division WOR-3 bacterium]MDW8151092.1 DNA translocase FtsK [candidate division WOR-3 bacterium]